MIGFLKDYLMVKCSACQQSYSLKSRESCPNCGFSVPAESCYLNIPEENFLKPDWEMMDTVTV